MKLNFFPYIILINLFLIFLTNLVMQLSTTFYANRTTTSDDSKKDNKYWLLFKKVVYFHADTCWHNKNSRSQKWEKFVY